jgi:hypothetical protein
MPKCSDRKREGNNMGSATTFEGIGPTLEIAVARAHKKIPARTGKDFCISRVIEWGMQTGGFVPSQEFYAKVEEDEKSPFKTPA